VKRSMKQKGKDLKIWSQKKERHIMKRSVKQKGKDIIRATVLFVGSAATH